MPGLEEYRLTGSGEYKSLNLHGRSRLFFIREMGENAGIVFWVFFNYYFCNCQHYMSKSVALGFGNLI